MARRWLLLAAALGGAATVRLPARADETGPTEPAVRVTLPWLATQLVPSPALALGSTGSQVGTHFGLAWQVTPLLFSWGVHRGLSPWRVFVAEPYVRQSGSIEVFVSPELYTVGPTPGDDVAGRAGLRSYFPLVEHGEYLSASLGASTVAFEGKAAVAYELGAYVLYGVVGLQTSVSPSGGPLSIVAMLRLRYF